MIDESLIASLSINDADIEALLKGSPAAGKSANHMDDYLVGNVADLTAGKLIKGKIVGFAGDDVVVEVGLKSEGLIPKEEFEGQEVRVGEMVDVLLEDIEGEGGLIQLSKRRADRLSRRGQTIVDGPQPPRNAGVPYTDPQPGGNAWVIGGWRDGFPWYYDEVAPGTGIGCLQGGVDTCQFYAGIAWAVNSPCITYLTGQTCPMFNYTPTRDLIVFSDTPQNPQASIQLSFQTRLVIVSADQSQWAYVAGFAWDWSNPSPLAGVASNFRALTSSELTAPPAARQGGGPPSPFDTNPPAHSSLGFPPNPVFQESLVTPEPSSLVLIGLGLIPLAALRRFRSR